MKVTPGSLVFNGTVGVNPASQVVQVSGAEGEWTARGGQSWLSCKPTTGKGDSGLEILVTVANVQVGEHKDSVVIETAEGKPGATVAVTLKLAAAVK